MINVDQLPSFPSQVWLVGKLNGCIWLLLVARGNSQVLILMVVYRLKGKAWSDNGRKEYRKAYCNIKSSRKWREIEEFFWAPETEASGVP